MMLNAERTEEVIMPPGLLRKYGSYGGYGQRGRHGHYGRYGQHSSNADTTDKTDNKTDKTEIQVQECEPHSVVDVLEKFFHIDFQTVLENYVETEAKQIQAAGILNGAAKLELRLWSYLKTFSKLQQPIERTAADVMLRGKLEGQYEDGTKRYAYAYFRLRYTFNLRVCCQGCEGPWIQVSRDWESAKALTANSANSFNVLAEGAYDTNDYLLPILYNDDYETVAHEMLDYYFPERNRAVGGDASVVSSGELARRMGLRVQEVRFADKAVMGQLYYSFGDVKLLDAKGREYLQMISPGTILINSDNCTSDAIRNSTIAHECCHMYLDRWFFLLQLIIVDGRRYVPYSSRRKENRMYHHKNGAIDWMELQCEKLPAYLLLERESVIGYIEGRLNQCGWKKTPENIRSIVDGIAERYGVSYQMAKYRMIELGYSDAGGIRNYVNDAVVPDHSCTCLWPADTTFTISAMDAAWLAAEDSAFEQVIRSGKYRYVEGHFCKNKEKYLCLDRYGKPHLTIYARGHIEECCLSFTVGGRYRKTEYGAGRVARNKTSPVEYKYRATYSFVAEPGSYEYDKENQAMVEDGLLWMELYNSRPLDFAEAIKMILDKKKITREKLALELGVDRRAVAKYLNQESPSRAHVVGLCVALKIPYYVSMDLIGLAGIRLKATQLDFVYRQFLMNAENLTVSRCEDTLKKYGMPPLFNGMSDE